MLEPYYVQLYNNGTLVNSQGAVMKDYVSIMEKACEDYGVYVINLEKESTINNYSAARYLEDGTHPTPAGCKVVADVLIEHLKYLLQNQ